MVPFISSVYFSICSIHFYLNCKAPGCQYLGYYPILIVILQDPSPKYAVRIRMFKSKSFFFLGKQ